MFIEFKPSEPSKLAPIAAASFLWNGVEASKKINYL